MLAEGESSQQELIVGGFPLLLLLPGRVRHLMRECRPFPHKRVHHIYTLTKMYI